MVFRRKNVVVSRGPTLREPALKPTNTNKHNGIRPSLVDSEPCASSGSRSLDKQLLHGGLRLPSLTMISEHGTTDFASAILKSMSSLSIQESRTGSPSKLIVIGAPDFAQSLPAVIPPKHTPEAETKDEQEIKANMKIAWRYAKHASSQKESKPSLFSPDIDFKKRMDPVPQGLEIATIPVANFASILQKLEQTLQTTVTTTLVRIVIPSFLHPALYDFNQITPDSVLPFLYNLKQMVQKFRNCCCCFSLPLQLYPKTESFAASMELLADNVLEIEPFDSTDDFAHGFLHINRISTLSDRGEMVAKRQELSFKLERRQFEVSTFSIPVDSSESMPKEKQEKESGKGKKTEESAPNLKKLQGDW